jgi:surface protein
MFQNCTAFNQALNSWDVADVTAFNLVFSGATAFNSNITSWNTAAATTMTSMFNGATSFNQAITGWNTGNVTTMDSMFSGATAFNQAIGVWSVPKVTTFASMFLNANAFNQDLGAWDVTITPRASLTMTGMLSTCGMNTANYDATLVAWVAQVPISSVVLGASGRTYTAAGAGGTARAALVAAPYNWTITGDSGV